MQSLKFKNPEMQEYVCTLVGKQAKFKGKKKNWYRTQTLYWKGVEINRHSNEYQELLDKAFECLSRNESFKKALLSTGNATLKHSIGKSDPHKIVLTEKEFCSRLMNIRDSLQK